jgi:UDP-N-acetyl-D-glucosamine dehydrogenase
MSDNEAVDHLLTRLDARAARIAVVGLGYVGLTLAVAAGRAGFRVTGIDVDLERVSLVRQGHSYIGDVPSEELRELVQAGRLAATTSIDQAARVDVIVICVPTPLRKSKEPDISFIVTAIESLLPHLRPGQLIVLESTTYPGTTEEVLQPRLESRGLTPGHDVFLAFSPERVDPGNRTFTTANIPKVVGGITSRCTELAARFYGHITPAVHRVSSPRVAETSKLLENTFRSVNIALANELALACRSIGVNPWEVIAAAATKPFGFMPFYPGPGTGGHCIPLDPLYLSWKLRSTGFETRFIALADAINHSMPGHAVAMVTDALNERGKCVRGSSVLVAGVTYKRDVNDIRESPALEIMRLLVDKGARVGYADPFVPQLAIGDVKIQATPMSHDLLVQTDCVVITTDHTVFDYLAIVREAPLVVDLRNALGGLTEYGHKVVAL